MDEITNIEQICRELNISNFTINDDFTVDVNGNVDLSGKGLTEIPLQFNRVEGDFNVSHNKLTSLKNSPTFCMSYNCYDNLLTSFEGISENIGESLVCHHNQFYSFNYLNCIPRRIVFPENLNYLFSLFGYRINLIEVFNDYDIIRAPEEDGELPRLRVVNLNSFLNDHSFAEVTNNLVLARFYSLR
jgi:hypothetical protein